jgi:hypothetical protein
LGGVVDRQRRHQLEHDGEVTRLQVEVDQRDALRDRSAAITARFDATSDLPEPPLVEKTTRPDRASAAFPARSCSAAIRAPPGWIASSHSSAWR